MQHLDASAARAALSATVEPGRIAGFAGDEGTTCGAVVEHIRNPRPSPKSQSYFRRQCGIADNVEEHVDFHTYCLPAPSHLTSLGEQENSRLGMRLMRTLARSRHGKLRNKMGKDWKARMRV